MEESFIFVSGDVSPSQKGRSGSGNTCQGCSLLCDSGSRTDWTVGVKPRNPLPPGRPYIWRLYSFQNGPWDGRWAAKAWACEGCLRYKWRQWTRALGAVMLMVMSVTQQCLTITPKATALPGERKLLLWTQNKLSLIRVALTSLPRHYLPTMLFCSC